MCGGNEECCVVVLFGVVVKWVWCGGDEECCLVWCGSEVCCGVVVWW